MPTYSAKRPMTVIVCVVLAIALGVISFTNMQTDLLPDLELPYIVVFTTYTGASPEKVETAVTKPLESALSTTSGLKSLTSVSSENTSMLVLEFGYSTNIDSAMIEMNGSIDLVKGYFEDSVSSPLLMRLDISMLPAMVAAVGLSDADAVETSRYMEDVVIPELERTEGVASVSAMGLVEQTIEVTLLPDKIEELNRRLLKDTEEELQESQDEIDDGMKEISDGRRDLKKEISDQRRELEDTLQDLIDGRIELEDSRGELEDKLYDANVQLSKLKEQKTQLQTLSVGAEKLPELEAGVAQAQAASAAAQGQIDTLNAELAAYDPNNVVGSRTDLVIQGELAAAQAAKATADTTATTLGAQKAGIEAGMSAAKVTTVSELLIMLDEVNGGVIQLTSGIAQLESAIKQLDSTEDTLNNSVKQVAEGKDKLNDAYSDGMEQLNDAKDQLIEAQEDFDEAREKAVKSIDMGGTVTESMIASMLMASNFSMPAGYAVEGEESYSVKVGELFDSIDDIENLLLFNLEQDDIGDVRLGDVARVELVNNAGDMYAKINGEDGMLLYVQKQSTASTTEVSKALRATAASLGEENPDLSFVSLYDGGVYIDIVLESVLQNLAMGAVLAILVLFLFLRSGRPTLIVALSIPISLLIAVVLMYFSGITLNLISLSGLALGIGMLVDNSIVVIENTFRLRMEGLSPVRAAVQGAKEVSGAIIASTLTTVCVFLPIVFAEGIAKELFADMGLTIGFSLLASLLVALSVVPALSSMMLKKDPPAETRFYTGLTNLYEKSIRWVLGHRFLTLFAATALLVVSIAGAVSKGTAFMPDSEMDQLQGAMTVPDGVTKADTRALCDEAARRIAAIDGVGDVGAMEASAGSLMGTGEGMSFYILLDSQSKRPSTDVIRDIEGAVADLDCEFTVSSATDISALSGSGIQLELFGNDLAALREAARGLAQAAKQVEGVGEVDDGIGKTQVETVVAVDRNKAMGYGLTVAQVYTQITDALKEQTQSTSLTIGAEEYDIVIKRSEDYARDELGDMVIRGEKDNTKERIPLLDIAEVTEAETQSAITRIDGSRTLTVNVGIAKGHNIGIVNERLMAALENYTLPEGVSLEYSGENETTMETLYELAKMCLLAILLIYLIMVAQFQSLLSPFIVMFTLPLAFTGGFLLEWAWGLELSVMSAIGMLVLVGVVVNNGIVFVDCANQLYAQGMDRREALATAGKRRMRPILMTALTTVLGLVTLALGLGMGAELLQPMAVIIIGGLSYGTLTTLYIVPALYDLFVKRPPRVVDTEA